MSPQRSWVKEFRRLLHKDGSILELELQAKHTTSWSNLKFDIVPADAALKLLEFVATVNEMAEKHIIDRSQAYIFIKPLLLQCFNFQFDVSFILPQQEPDPEETADRPLNETCQERAIKGWIGKGAY
jgi:hypothetical protein